MKIHIIFNFFIQVLILWISVFKFYEPFNIKFVISLLLIWIIFIPEIIHFKYHKYLKNMVYYVFTLICLLIFIFVIAF